MSTLLPRLWCADEGAAKPADGPPVFPPKGLDAEETEADPKGAGPEDGAEVLVLLLLAECPKPLEKEETGAAKDIPLPPLKEVALLFVTTLELIPKDIAGAPAGDELKGLGGVDPNPALLLLLLLLPKEGFPNPELLLLLLLLPKEGFPNPELGLPNPLEGGAKEVTPIELLPNPLLGAGVNDAGAAKAVGAPPPLAKGELGNPLARVADGGDPNV